jgi:hypothetical protein
MFGFLLARLFKLVTKSCVLDMNKRFQTFLDGCSDFMFSAEARPSGVGHALVSLLVFPRSGVQVDSTLFSFSRDPYQLMDGAFCKIRRPLWTPQAFIFQGPLACLHLI